MFIFFINGSNIYSEYNITIYKNSKIIYNGKTKNNRLKYNFKKNNIYTIKLVNNQYGIYRYIPYYCTKENEVNYYNIKIPSIIKLKLLDNYYKIPIEKGNIILWPNMK